MDYFSRLLVKAANQGFTEVYLAPDNNLHITHLFANDILLFLTLDEAKLKNLKFLVKTFKIASDLKTNLHKSLVLSVDTTLIDHPLKLNI